MHHRAIQVRSEKVEHEVGRLAVSEGAAAAKVDQHLLRDLETHVLVPLNVVGHYATS
jgi:hypothetical protein